MAERLPEWLAVMLGGLLLASPALIAGVLMFWARNITSRGATPVGPLTLGLFGVVAGVIRLATTQEGMGGIYEAIIGVYVAGAGGLVIVVCAAMMRSSRSAPEGD